MSSFTIDTGETSILKRQFVSITVGRVELSLFLNSTAHGDADRLAELLGESIESITFRIEGEQRTVTGSRGDAEAGM